VVLSGEWPCVASEQAKVKTRERFIQLCSACLKVCVSVLHARVLPAVREGLQTHQTTPSTKIPRRRRTPSRRSADRFRRVLRLPHCRWKIWSRDHTTTVQTPPPTERLLLVALRGAAFCRTSMHRWCVDLTIGQPLANPALLPPLQPKPPLGWLKESVLVCLSSNRDCNLVVKTKTWRRDTCAHVGDAPQCSP